MNETTPSEANHNPQALTTSPESVETENTASQYVEQVLEILEEEGLTPEELMEEVCSLVDDYRSELSAQATAKTLEANLAAFTTENDDELFATVDVNRLRPAPGLNAGKLLEEATKLYVSKIGLSDKEYAALSAAEKLKHRPALTEVYNNLVKNSVSEKTSQTYSQGPFRRIPTDGVPEENANDAKDAWYKEQVADFEFKLGIVNDEIEDLLTQNEVPQISSAVRNRNLIRIKDLQAEAEELTKQLSHYKQ